MTLYSLGPGGGGGSKLQARSTTFIWLRGVFRHFWLDPETTCFHESDSDGPLIGTGSDVANMILVGVVTTVPNLTRVSALTTDTMHGYYRAHRQCHRDTVTTMHAVTTVDQVGQQAPGLHSVSFQLELKSDYFKASINLVAITL